jgi:hypothetical protein
MTPLTTRLYGTRTPSEKISDSTTQPTMHSV